VVSRTVVLQACGNCPALQWTLISSPKMQKTAQMVMNVVRLALGEMIGVRMLHRMIEVDLNTGGADATVFSAISKGSLLP
jgi:hypothetical protein